MSSKAPPPPTIVVDQPTTTKPRPTASHLTELPKHPTTTTNGTTTTSPSSSSDTDPTHASCYLCDEQNPGDFSPTTKFLDKCLLCSRSFCPIHRSSAWDSVCNINHSTYYHECLMQLAKDYSPQGGPEMGKKALAAVLVSRGIFPSLGEREKAIFTSSEISEAQLREIESYRSLDAQLAGTKDVQSKEKLIEEKDLVGADIAV